MAHARKVLVTGATSGIGRACVEVFLKAGWEAWACGRRSDRLEAMQEEHGDSLHTFVLDVRDAHATERTLAEVPVVDVLVSNAGLSLGLGPLWEGSLEDWNAMLDTNVKGLLHVTRFLLPRMIERGSGHVIHLGSVAGHEAYPNGVVYCASKHAVTALTRGLRMDTSGTGVKISSVDPGLVDTEFSTVRFHGDQERADQVYANMTPLVAQDVAETVLWVAQRPAHVNPAEILLLPTDQASAYHTHRTT